MKKNKNKIFFIIACLLFALSIFAIIGTYAKYITAASGNASLKIAKWDIKVNSQSIKNNSDISTLITPTFAGSTNIAEGVIAPNATGYFDLNLDFTNADVSCNYSISISSTNSNVKDLVVTGYSVDGGSVQTVTDGSNASITGTYNTTDTTKSHSIRVNILWNDDDATQSMNNYDDTLATISNVANATASTNATTTMNVNVAFTQIR